MCEEIEDWRKCDLCKRLYQGVIHEIRDFEDEI